MALHQVIKNKRAGRRVEKIHARRMGARHIGPLSGEDSWHPVFSIESKVRKKFVGEKWMIQAEANAHGKSPLVRVHIPGQRFRDDIIMIRAYEFEDYLGEFERRENDEQERTY